MALPSPFTLPQSPFNAFLFALIGQERNGTPLSVVSALARLEFDPWQEAARLAELPVERAAAALETLIRRLPAGAWDQAETRAIAARLAALLPRRGGGTRQARAVPAGSATARPPALLWLALAALTAVLLFSLLANGAPRAPDHGASTPLTDAARPAAKP